MAKKKAKSSPTRRSQPQYCFRCELDESETFERIAQQEGFKTVASWVYALAKRRASKMLDAVKTGAYVTHHEQIVPVDEVRGADASECRIANSEAIIARLHPDSDELTNASYWLALAFRHGSDLQRQRVSQLVSRLPPEYQRHYDACLDFASE